MCYLFCPEWSATPQIIVDKSVGWQSYPRVIGSQSYVSSVVMSIVSKLGYQGIKG
jgi:hypothetical protein